MATTHEKGLKDLASVDNEKYLSSGKVRQRYDDATIMTLHRWVNHPTLGFPKPTYMNGRRYWKLSELLEYERRCAARSRGKDTEVLSRGRARAHARA